MTKTSNAPSKSSDESARFKKLQQASVKRLISVVPPEKEVGALI
jgi:hypothetical protein